MYPTFASCEEMFLTLSWSNISLLEAAAAILSLMSSWEDGEPDTLCDLQGRVVYSKEMCSRNENNNCILLYY